MIITLIALAIMLALFTSLTIKCDNRELIFYFGPGVIKKRIPYDQISSAAKVRNRWFYGWGVRWYGPGWLYNVSGLDAIELVLKNGKQLRIGTDEPDELIRFLQPKILNK